MLRSYNNEATSLHTAYGVMGVESAKIHTSANKVFRIVLKNDNTLQISHLSGKCSERYFRCVQCCHGPNTDSNVDTFPSPFCNTT